MPKVRKTRLEKQVKGVSILNPITYVQKNNLSYIEELYRRYQETPESVEPDWRLFFEGVDFANNIPLPENQKKSANTPSLSQTGLSQTGFSKKELKVCELIEAYRQYGHLYADVDPLKEKDRSADELSLEKHGLNQSDLEQDFEAGQILGLRETKLKKIIESLKSNYCGTLSIQFAEASSQIRQWFIAEFEEPDSFTLCDDDKKRIFYQIAQTESLEKFIHNRFVGSKRFSIEGADALIPMLEWFAAKSTGLGIEEMVIGMAHRGRINVLANFMGKGLDVILADFEGIKSKRNEKEKISDFHGDVKYHLGYSTDKITPSGSCHVSLAFNPSHLEAVNPVVCGMTRAKQRIRKNTESRDKVVPVLIHGDAAFAGQGIVAETFQMSQLKGYTVGGTIHLVIDNQIGFTATPNETRSSTYSSDISKILHTPVIHVNGDDVEACVRAMDMAMRFRQEFKKDIVINLVCYRRFGHNEGDEPSFTSPLMYQKIKKHPPLGQIYGEYLLNKKLINQDDYRQQFEEKLKGLQIILENIRKAPPSTVPLAFEGLWSDLRRAEPKDFENTTDTTCSMNTLEEVADILTQIPEGFTPLPKLKKLIEQRTKMKETSVVDWGFAELLCYGSLIKEGTSVRLSGQDSVRGTFSHRHSGYRDIKTGNQYIPLKYLCDEKEFCVYDSYLSEMAVLGFEYGNSISDPHFLYIWEAQFGDFANGAQIIIDQFISSGETKWQRMTGLVLLLPHGYEGQGPEHSSARLERFLQLCAQNNMQVCNPTTPAQFFHLLRRQVKREFRKPLVIMSPKSILRHPRVISPMSELAEGRFHEILFDKNMDPKKVETVILCSGKIYYELLEERERLLSGDDAGAGDGASPSASDPSKTTIFRLEQIYPFPEKHLKHLLSKTTNLKHIVWAQEEPKNMGAFSSVAPNIQTMMDKFEIKKVDFSYVGRDAHASPATGSLTQHRQQQEKIVKTCFQC